MLFLLTESPQKLKSENIHDTLIILLYVSPRFPQLQKRFLLKHTQKKKTSTAAVDPSISKWKLQTKIFLIAPMLYIELANIEC